MNMQEKILSLLEDRKITPAALAREIGIPNSTLADILKGKTERVAINTIFPIANFFGCSVNYLALDELSDPGYDKPATPDERKPELSERQRKLGRLNEMLDRVPTDQLDAITALFQSAIDLTKK